MANRGHVISIASDTKPFEQGVRKGIIAPLEDAEDTLKDLANNRGPMALDDSLSNAGDAADQLGRSDGPSKLERALRDAQGVTDALRDKTRRTADSIGNEYRDGYRKAERAADSFGDQAGENVKNFKEEAVQNFSEVASSFSGDLSQMSDGVQGLTGGLAASLTPGIGIPVAILGAAAAAFFASWQQKAEATKQLVSDMYDDMTASGEAFLSQDFIQQGIAKAYRDQYDDVKKRGEELGVDHHVVAAAMAGDEAAINQLLDVRNAKRDDEIAAAKKQGGGWREVQGRVMELNAQYKAQSGWLDDVADATKKAKGEARDANAATSDYLKTAIRNAGTASDEVDKLGNHLVTLPTGKQIMIDAKTGQARSDISQFKGDLDGKVPKRKTVEILADTSGYDDAMRRLKARPPVRVAVDLYATSKDRRIQ